MTGKDGRLFMRKLILFHFLILLTFCSSRLYSQTNVSGIISADIIWTKANSPYQVTGNVVVNQSVSLTIEAGTEIKFDKDKKVRDFSYRTSRF